MALPPSWATRSISTNPGTASSHCAQVRIGIGVLEQRPRLGARAARAARSAAGSRPAAVDLKSAADLTIMIGGISKQIYLPYMLAQQLGLYKKATLPRPWRCSSMGCNGTTS